MQLFFYEKVLLKRETALVVTTTVYTVVHRFRKGRLRDS